MGESGRSLVKRHRDGVGLRLPAIQARRGQDGRTVRMGP